MPFPAGLMAARRGAMGSFGAFMESLLGAGSPFADEEDGEGGEDEPRRGGPNTAIERAMRLIQRMHRQGDNDADGFGLPFPMPDMSEVHLFSSMHPTSLSIYPPFPSSLPSPFSKSLSSF